jgi:plasmid stabilization system protein ParE
MSFRVEIARKAAREIEANYDWLAERSQVAADRWRDFLLEAIDSLADDPERCPEAPEGEWYPGLRQLLHRRRRQVHRILFGIAEVWSSCCACATAPRSSSDRRSCSRTNAKEENGIVYSSPEK